jgi:hypothetical protein
MLVNRRDACCRSCGGTLEIVDVDDATMTVECRNPECSDSYSVEPDAFGDGAMTYYPAALQEKCENGGAEDDAP